MPERHQFEIYFPALGEGGEYIVILHRTDNERPRPMKAVAPSDLYPDHNVALMHKGAPITAWAHRELAPAVASHVERFMRTRDPRELRTLTDLEREQLFAKARELEIPLKSGGRYRV